ncbi:MAG TPA: ABC transporter permease [Sphingobacteriaceae bacterium]|nr:ABC transporter permease [Sphingobacteriaceae bacterium]
MYKVLLIIEREYLSRVKKRSFLVATFLLPVLLIGMFALITFLTRQGSDVSTQIDVVDESGIFANKFHDSKPVDFSISTQSLAEAKKKTVNDENSFLLIIPKDVTKDQIQLFSQKKAGFQALDVLESQMNDILRAKMLVDAGINQQTLDNIKPNVSIISKEISPEGEKDSSSGAAYGVGFASAILIYMSLFIYGAQVMRGVIEEKTNRIIEVVISSVKPFQLMMGKIIGIGMVGLTQFLLWIVLSTTLMTVTGKILATDNQIKTEHVQGKQSTEAAPEPPVKSPMLNAVSALQSLPFGFIITVFFVYFLGGYMLYSALFAAVGSAVDNDTETQQFMFPITMPLLFTYILSFTFIVNNPDSTLSFWLSIIPFTSPVAMMVRLPFGVPAWQLAISITLLIAGFIFTTWVAARIYRVGILMYGKKASYKELIKWFSYKE